jgi:hypothetical protein
MNEKTITIDGIDGEISITVCEADLRAGFKRGRLLRELIYNDSLQERDPDLANARAVYVDLMCATVEATGFHWSMSVEEFEALTDLWFDRVGLPWLAAVRELNPHWAPDWLADQGEAQAAAE